MRIGNGLFFVWNWYGVEVKFFFVGIIISTLQIDSIEATKSWPLVIAKNYCYVSFMSISLLEKKIVIFESIFLKRDTHRIR